ncbi:MAG: BON domain-containing protein [Thermoguttaceae bacterium]
MSRIREQLEDHPHFRGRTHLLQIEATGGSIVVSGRLPTYYLKQLLQEVIKAIPDVAGVDNCVDVTYR